MRIKPNLLCFMTTLLFGGFAHAEVKTSPFYFAYETGDEDKARTVPYLALLEHTRPKSTVDAEIAKWLSSPKNREEGLSLLGQQYEKLEKAKAFVKAKVAAPKSFEISRLNGSVIFISPAFCIAGNDPSFSETDAYFLSKDTKVTALLAHTGLDLSFCGKWSKTYDQARMTTLDGEAVLAIREQETYCVVGDEDEQPTRYRWLLYSPVEKFKSIGDFKKAELPAKLCRLRGEVRNCTDS